MKSQIVWIAIQLIILSLVWMGTRVQVGRGEKTIFQASGAVLGTLAYFLINNTILYFGGFFDVIIHAIFK